MLPGLDEQTCLFWGSGEPLAPWFCRRYDRCSAFELARTCEPAILRFKFGPVAQLWIEHVDF